MQRARKRHSASAQRRLGAWLAVTSHIPAVTPMCTPLRCRSGLAWPLHLLELASRVPSPPQSLLRNTGDVPSVAADRLPETGSVSALPATEDSVTGPRPLAPRSGLAALPRAPVGGGEGGAYALGMPPPMAVRLLGDSRLPSVQTWPVRAGGLPSGGATPLPAARGDVRGGPPPLVRLGGAPLQDAWLPRGEAPRVTPRARARGEEEPRMAWAPSPPAGPDVEAARGLLSIRGGSGPASSQRSGNAARSGGSGGARGGGATAASGGAEPDASSTYQAVAELVGVNVQQAIGLLRARGGSGGVPLPPPRE
jgi:hypothetical protein